MRARLRVPTFDYQKQVFLGSNHLQMPVANVLEAPIGYKQLKWHDRLLFKKVIHTPLIALLKSKSCITTTMH